MISAPVAAARSARSRCFLGVEVTKGHNSKTEMLKRIKKRHVQFAGKPLPPLATNHQTGTPDLAVVDLTTHPKASSTPKWHILPSLKPQQQSCNTQPPANKLQQDTRHEGSKI